MNEILYTGLPSVDKMSQIVAACHFGPDALFLAEQLPTHTIVTREERYALLRFSYAKEGTPCTEYTSGRIFQPDRELRWEKQRDQIRVIYLGPAEDNIAGILEEYRLRSKQETLNALTKNTKPTWYSLFGERIKSEDLPYFGKSARPGDFAVVRIPRVLRYPVAINDEPSARLLVCEYHNKATDSVDLFRFQAAEAWDDKNRGGSV